MQAVRPFGSPAPPDQTGGPRRLLVAISMGVVAVVAILFAPAAGDVEVAVVDPPAPIAGDADVDVVAEFHSRLAVGDASGAAELVAGDAARLDLAGLPPGLLRGGEGLAAGLEGFQAAIGGGPGDCRSTPGRLTSGEVTCTVTQAGPWAAAVGLAGTSVDVTYRVDDGMIAGAVARARPALAGLCMWAEQYAGAGVFDSDCRPLVGAPLAEVAAGYVAAGRPAPSDRYLAARRGARGVRLLVRAHNRGRDTAGMRAPGVAAGGFPGLVGEGPAPLLGDYMRWSQVVYRIRLGTCSVDGTRIDAGLQVDCPEARWTGPLVQGLALDPVRQPVTFTTHGAVLLSADGATEPGLAAAYERFCSWVHDRRPEVAPYLFVDGCRPIFTANAAGRLLMTLSDYTDGAR